MGNPDDARLDREVCINCTKQREKTWKEMRLSNLRILLDVTAQPGDQRLEAELISFVERGDECVGFLSIGHEPRSVDGERGIHRGESRALVAVDERMILRQAFPQRGGFLNQVGVITGLRPVKGGFQKSWISETL